MGRFQIALLLLYKQKVRNPMETNRKVRFLQLALVWGIPA